jgi:ATP-dependent Clp protease protease subunit
MEHHMAEKTAKEDDIDRLQFIEKELIDTRTLIVSEAIDGRLAKNIYSKLLILEKVSFSKPIIVIINSHGGDANSGFGIYDMLKFLKPPVITITAGLCASAAIMVFLAGDKKRRFALPNSRFLIHQPSTSAVGPASDLEITANQILKIRDQFNLIIANETGQDVAKITEDANRDFWMTSSEAVEYGLVSKIIETRADLDKYK